MGRRPDLASDSLEREDEIQLACQRSPETASIWTLVDSTPRSASLLTWSTGLMLVDNLPRVSHRKRQCWELRRGGEAIVPAIHPPSRRLPKASHLLDSIMVSHRTRVIASCRQMRHHIPPVAPPAVVDRTQDMKRR